MNILLIYPPFERLMRVANEFFPLSLGYIAAVLREAGHQVRIYNADIGPETADLPRYWLNPERGSQQDTLRRALDDPKHPVWGEIRNILREQKPDLVGITVSSPTFPSTKVVARLVKEQYPRCPVVCGGSHVTVCWQEVMDEPNVDFVVRGEGEETIVELADAIEKGRSLQGILGVGHKTNGQTVMNSLRPYIANLDSIPFPAKDLSLFPEHYSTDNMGVILSARGCPFGCTFCDAHAIWGRRPRFRSAENVIAEIQQIRRDYQCARFDFLDDTLTFNKPRLEKLCRSIRNVAPDIEWACYSRANALDLRAVRMLRSAGCTGVSVGLESGSERMLRIMKKAVKVEDVRKACKLLRRHAVQISTTVLIGTPEEKEEDIRQTIRLLRELKPDIVTVNTYCPYPGSEMYDQVKQLGLIEDTPDWTKLSHSSALSGFSIHISPERFDMLREQLFRAAYECNARWSLFNVRRWLNQSGHLIRHDPKQFLMKAAKTIALRLNIARTRLLHGSAAGTTDSATAP